MSTTVLSGRYRLIGRVGAGGMGVVWRAEDLVLHREVAVKTVAGPGVTDDAAQRLEREARAAAGLSDNPHVVTVHDFGRDGDTLFIVMALVAGRPLDRILAADGPPAAARAVDWARQVCLALEAAHAQGVVHRDIKPANAILGPDGTIRVLDFGIAWFHPDLGLDRLSRAGGVLGSVPWMSPEQARGEEVGPASDLYSLGCLLYQLLTGKPPFGDREALAQIVAHASEVPAPPSASSPGAPADLDLLVAELLAKSPENRPASAAETAARLGALARQLGAEETVGRRPVEPPPVPPAPSAPAHLKERPVSRRTVLFGVVGVATVSTTVVVVPKVLKGSAGDDGNGENGGKSGSPKALTPRWKQAVSEVAIDVIGGDVLTKASGEDRWVLRDLGTGEERWRTDEGAQDVLTGPGGRLYLNDSHASLLQVDQADGSTRWMFTPLQKSDVTSGLSAKAARDIVYVASGQHVYAVSAESGTEVWRHTGRELSAYLLLSQADGLILVCDNWQTWVALDLDTGDEVWSWQFASQSEPGEKILGFHGAVDNRIYLRLGNDTKVLDPASGKVLATYANWTAELVPELKLFLANDSGGQGAAAWRAGSNRALWSVPDAVIVALRGETVVLHQYDTKTKQGSLSGRDATSGKEQWRHRDLFIPAAYSDFPPYLPGDAPLIVAALDGDHDAFQSLDPVTGNLGPLRTVAESRVTDVRTLGGKVFFNGADPEEKPKKNRPPETPRPHRLFAFDPGQFT
ncbi:protein kinase [Streptomyces sp. NPDC015220]|uniref:protein kinase domain-containing protein n=1 Tax=Streptomyces sp. NPDC015220 TaxID=3364947 RepID=UPI0036F869A6